MMTRAKLLVEQKDKDGNPIYMVYHIALTQMRMDHEFEQSYNIFDVASRVLPSPIRISVDGYLTDPNPRPWDGPMPNAEQEEVEPAQLAITSNDDIIEGEIIEDDLDDDWRED